MSERSRAAARRPWWFYPLTALTGIGFIVAPYLIFVTTPVVPSMGLSQKIFYFHVPCAWLMMLAALLSGVSGTTFLFLPRGPRPRRESARSAADRFCGVTAELVVIFGVLVMTTGPLWAKKAWGHYWVWDARLTTLLMLLLTFLAARIARRYAGPAGRQISAGMAMFGALNVPLVYAAVKIWTTAHPPATVARALSPALRPALFVSLATFTALFGLLLVLSLGVERQRALTDDLRLRLAELRADARRRRRAARADGADNKEQ